MNKKEVDRLVAGINPRAKMPRGFSLWSPKMQLMWLRQNQRRKEKRDEV